MRTGGICTDEFYPAGASHYNVTPSRDDFTEFIPMEDIEDFSQDSSISNASADLVMQPLVLVGTDDSITLVLNTIPNSALRVSVNIPYRRPRGAHSRPPP